VSPLSTPALPPDIPNAAGWHQSPLSVSSQLTCCQLGWKSHRIEAHPGFSLRKLNTVLTAPFGHALRPISSLDNRLKRSPMAGPDCHSERNRQPLARSLINWELLGLDAATPFSANVAVSSRLLFGTMIGSSSPAGEWVQVVRVEQRIMVFYCATLIRELDPNCKGCLGTKRT